MMAAQGLLDAASLLHLLSKLDGPDVAKCACVCRDWRTVAYSERLWQSLCKAEEPHHLFREDVLQELGGSCRRYFAWRHPRAHRRVNKLCILDSLGSGQTRLQLAEVGQSHAGGYLAHNVATIRPPGSHLLGSATKPAWSPVGGLLAYSCPSQASVVVVDSQGHKVAEAELDCLHSLVFYIHWAPCGTRLLLLNARRTGGVALWAWDVAAALAPAGTARRPRPPVLLATAQPLFLTCCPTSTRVLWHGNMRDFGLVDCATDIDEDGSEHDRVLSNPVPGGGRAPQWVADAQGREWLLLSLVREEAPEEGAPAAAPGAAGPGEGGPAAGELVLLPVDLLEEAYEMGGSVLSVDLVRSLSTQVCRLANVDNLSFAANVDCSIVAWSEACHVFVRFMGAGLSERPARLPVPARFGGGGAPVVAMQWSPDGRKLLMLALNGNDWFWVVWHAPTAPPREDDYAAMPPGVAPAPGALGALMLCATHQPSAAFQSEYLPFFDQFAQSVRLWSPGSDAFCYPALDASHRPGLRDIGRESSYIFVQPVPTVAQLEAAAAAGADRGEGEGSDSGSSSSAGGGEGGAGSSSTSASSRAAGARQRGRRRRGGALGQQEAGAGLAVYEGPPPSRIMPGALAIWSCT